MDKTHISLTQQYQFMFIDICNHQKNDPHLKLMHSRKPTYDYLNSAVFMSLCSSLMCSQWLFGSWGFEWSSAWSLKTNSPSCPCEASLIAFVCMHILYLSGGSSSAHLFSCHRWKRLRDGERTTISLLWRYFLYRCTSSNPQPLMVRSKPPERKKTPMLCDTQSSKSEANHTYCESICAVR